MAETATSDVIATYSTVRNVTCRHEGEGLKLYGI